MGEKLEKGETIVFLRRFYGYQHNSFSSPGQAFLSGRHSMTFHKNREIKKWKQKKKIRLACSTRLFGRKRGGKECKELFCSKRCFGYKGKKGWNTPLSLSLLFFAKKLLLLFFPFSNRHDADIPRYINGTKRKKKTRTSKCRVLGKYTFLCSFLANVRK